MGFRVLGFKFRVGYGGGGSKLGALRGIRDIAGLEGNHEGSSLGIIDGCLEELTFNHKGHSRVYRLESLRFWGCEYRVQGLPKKGGPFEAGRGILL